MPGVRCARNRVCRGSGVAHTRSQVTPETSGIPRAMVYGLFRTLPGDRAFLSPSLANESANLTPASRRQDHTTSPSASALFVKSAARVHRIPPRVRDDREPPLGLGRDSGGYKTDLGAAASIISEIPKLFRAGASRKGRSSPLVQPPNLPSRTSAYYFQGLSACAGRTKSHPF